MQLHPVRLSLVALLIAAAARAQAPRVELLDPAQGPIAGGTAVTIRGANLAGATVAIDAQSVAVTQVSPAELRVTTPKHDNGYALVKVFTAVGSAYAEFLYVPPKLEDLPTGYITTIAGVGDYFRFHLPANTASIRSLGIATDSQGNILFAGYNRILEVRKDGTLEPFAGNGLMPDEFDNGDGGPALAAGISFCRTVALDGAGNAYIPDESHRVRRVDAAAGIISTITGTGVRGFSGDGGPAIGAQINQPNFLAADADGTLYFGDHGNARIRKISTAGVISTIAGTGVVGNNGDGGLATEARLDWPKAGADADEIALDRTRHLLYVEEYFAGRVRRIDLRTGIITAFFAGDPPAFPLVHPWGLAVDSASNVYIASEGQIVKLDSAGRVLHRWGTVRGFSEDGTPLDEMLIGHPGGLAVEADGNILFSESLANRLRRMNFATGRLETVAGIAPSAFGVPGPAIAAVLIGPDGDVAFLPSGDLLFGDTGSIRIFRIDPAGQITEFGGTGMNWSAEPRREGMPISRISISPVALAVDALGGVYTCDSAEIDYIDPDGIFHGVTQSWPIGYAGDGGPARDALLMEPFDVTLDLEGNMYIADSNNNRIRRVDRQTGIITTVAGSGPSNEFDGFGQGSYCGDGGPALEACFNSPMALAVDPDGNIFVQDFYNHRIRKIDTRGIVSTFANNRIGGKMVADAYGGLFVSAMQVIHRYLPDRTFWPVAGTYERGFSGDGGPAREAKITAESLTAGLAVDREGNLFFHDVMNRRIRAVRFGAVLAPPGGKATRVQGSQTVGVSHTVSTPIEASVTTADGRPAPNVRVDFTAPPSAASCVFANGSRTASARTDRNGRASVTCTAACTPGSFELTASPLVAGDQPAIGPVSFSLTSSGTNPVPHIDAVTRLPDGATLQLRGTDFSPCSVVRWNGSDRPTTFVSTGELRAAISASDLTTGGTAQITATTPAPGGGASNSVAFHIGGRKRSVRH